MSPNDLRFKFSFLQHLQPRYLLCQQGWFGDVGALSMQQRLDASYQRFRDYCKTHRIFCSQKQFMVKHVALKYTGNFFGVD